MGSSNATDQQPPAADKDANALASSIKSLDDLILVEYVDPVTQKPQKKFLYLNEDDQVFYGSASKDEMSLSEYIEALAPVPDAEVFPEVPTDSSLTIAGDKTDEFFCKRPGLAQYQPGVDTGTPSIVLEETLIMETLAKHPHPNIVPYKGCRVKRGRITGIFLSKYDMSLQEFVFFPDFKDLDPQPFLAAIASALEHLHALGLAHNDINPGNIMIDDSNAPVLIDFGSCQPFGRRLQTFGTPGWMEGGTFWTSEKSHDTYSFAKLQQWLAEEKAKVAEERAKVAEERAKVAEERAKVAEEKAKVAEEKAKVAEEKAKVAEEKAKVAEEKAKVLAKAEL